MSEDTENKNPDDEPGDDVASENGDTPPPQEESSGLEGLIADDDDEAEILFGGPDRLVELEEQVAELKDKLLRAVAETENVRRRAQREKEDASKYAIAGFAGDMVSVADNMTRALDSIDADARAADKLLDNLMTGVEMTLRELFSSFERTGIKQIDALDKPFDHNLHEALFEMEDPDKPSGTVVQVVQQGFTIRDRLLRPAKVGVSKGGAKTTPLTGDEQQTQADEAAREKAPETTKAYQQGQQGPGANLDEEL